MLTPHRRTIGTEADLADAVSALVGAEPKFAAIVGATGLPPLRRRKDGLAGLLRIIADQQISLASAAAIWGRFEAAFAPFDAERLAAAGDEALRACGLSAAKIRTFRALAAAVSAGVLDFSRLESLNDDEVVRELTAISGIGPWTAEIYLLTCMGRPDVWPTGDLALKLATASAFQLADRPSPAEMVRIAAPWRPWRAVAARLLWAHYRHVKGLPRA
jgi:DNA-3-methyladenine glycosylase II